jgi:hypothetical protein
LADAKADFELAQDVLPAEFCPDDRNSPGGRFDLALDPVAGFLYITFFPVFIRTPAAALRTTLTGGLRAVLCFCRFGPSCLLFFRFLHDSRSFLEDSHFPAGLPVSSQQPEDSLYFLTASENRPILSIMASLFSTGTSSKTLPK